MTDTTRIGIDLGGTKIAAIGLGQNDKILFEDRIPTPKDDYTGTLDAINQLVDAARLASNASASIGIGIPGSISPQSGVVQNANSTWLNGKNLTSDLANRLGQDVRIANDANCLALSESHDGVGKGFSSIFAVIVGTGCGAGLVINKTIHVGRHGIAGEWGHTPLPWAKPTEIAAPQCWCGHSSCLETWISGSGLERDFYAINQINMSGQDIVKSAKTGDAAALLALENHCDRMARGLAMVSNIVDPDIIVLGGGLSNMEHLYDQLGVRMKKYIACDHFIPNIARARHGDASGVRGAARLWDQ